ncbi:MAG: hypothetical protein ABL993_14745 [Vicinamibacterales bacterium]
MYFHGCNYPWSTDGTTVFYGLDFGANVWGSHLGVSTRRTAIRHDFAEMAALGFTVVRWFLFCDGRAGIVYDERGMPIGPDAHLFADLDAALEIAGAVGIGIDLVLFDHRWMFSGVRETLPDPVTGDLLDVRLPEGRAHVFLNEDGRDALFEGLVVPLVHRYGPAGLRADLAPHVFAYEFMNEPDFVIEEWERDLSPHVARPLPFSIMATLIARLSETVHAHSSALTTLGGARLHNLWAWDDETLGLDLLQVHSYAAQTPGGEDDVVGVPVADLGVSRPVVLGEFGGYPVDDVLAFAAESGYAGAWPWSFSGTDSYGPLPREALQRFAARYPRVVNARAGVLGFEP